MGKNNTKLTTTDFIEKSIKIHNNYYDYSLVKYVDMKTKVEIICPIHGVFEQIPLSHIHHKSGCSKCKKNIMSQEEFIKKCKIIHNNYYDYSLVIFKNVRDRIKIICPKHGIFEQVASNHLHNKNKCFHCLTESKRLTNEEFIKKSNIIHNNKYDYSVTNYINCLNNVKIICPLHGVFEQNSNNHLQGYGCPHCKESRGEREICKLLDTNNIRYIRQYKFDDCKGKKNKLPFDFYLTDFNTCIEFDGELHFTSNYYFGGEKRLKETEINDKIKTEYCNKNKINLLRIKYNENIKETILSYLI